MKLVAETEAQFGRLDILVNNAGTAIRKMPQDYTEEEWHTVLDTNLTSAFLLSQAAYHAMKRAGGGKMINIGSMMSLFGAPYATPYGSSKGGIVQMTRSLATAWAKDNIQVNAVLPGWIDTELTQRARQQVSGLHERVENRTPAGRWGTPADMAGVAAFLASPASDFVSGRRSRWMGAIRSGCKLRDAAPGDLLSAFGDFSQHGLTKNAIQLRSGSLGPWTEARSARLRPCAR